MAHHLLLPAFGQVLVAVHQVLDDAHHLDYELPVLVLLLPGLLDGFRILVEALLAVGLHPGQGLLILGLVVDALCHAADDLHLVHGLHPHAQVLLDEGRVDDGAADAHADGTDLQVGFPTHGGHCHCGAAEAQELLLHVLRDGGIVRLLHVMAIDAESGQALLGMGGQH